MSNESKSSKHTPGPWIIRGEGSELRITARGEIVSGVVAEVRTGWPHPAQRDEQRANARLIAAAPELLESLNALRSFMWALGYADQELVMAQADAAIAKAVQA